MKLLERIQIMLAGMFLALAGIHFEILTDLDEAAYWVMGMLVLCLAIDGIAKARRNAVDASADNADLERGI